MQWLFYLKNWCINWLEILISFISLICLTTFKVFANFLLKLCEETETEWASCPRLICGTVRDMPVFFASDFSVKAGFKYAEM